MVAETIQFFKYNIWLCPQKLNILLSSFYLSLKNMSLNFESNWVKIYMHSVGTPLSRTYPRLDPDTSLNFAHCACSLLFIEPLIGVLIQTYCKLNICKNWSSAQIKWLRLSWPALWFLLNDSGLNGPRASFVRPGKGISQNTMRYEYWSLSH